MDFDDQLRRRLLGLEAELLEQLREVDPERPRRRARRRRHAQLALAGVGVAILVGGMVVATPWLRSPVQYDVAPLASAPSVTVQPTTTSGPPTTAPPTTIAPPATTTAPGAAGSVGLRWRHDNGRCTAYPKPVINRTWQVAAPRLKAVSPGGSVPLWLRNKQAPSNGGFPTSAPELFKPAPAVDIYATVVFPNGSRYTSRPLPLDRQSQEVTITYPRDFPRAQPTSAAGDYTVVWSTAAGFLACDGFQVAR